jgi:hypothetical protein
MPNTYFIAFELIVYLLFLVCLRHAWRTGLDAVLRLVAASLFGVLLELATIWQLDAYSYGTFLVMIANVPLAIGVGWGTIIYSAKLFSDATSLPEWARPVLDGLLALNIDLAMDAVAIRLGMWDWGQGLDFQYFGVPYANFWAWFWVVLSFSAGWRWLSNMASRSWRWGVPLGAIAIGLGGVLGTNYLIVYIVPSQLYEITIALTLASALLVVLWRRPRLTARLDAPPAFWVPFGFHAYFLAAGLISGTILSPTILLAVSVVMFVVALVLHRSVLPYWRTNEHSG